LKLLRIYKKEDYYNINTMGEYMIIKCDNKRKLEILNYIGNDFHRCLYLYLDLIKYGCENPNINVWIQKDDNAIKATILKYYTGMHVFSREYNIDFEEIKELIQMEKPSMICGEPETIDKLNNGLYASEHGWIRKMDSLTQINTNLYDDVYEAKEEDFMQVAELIYNDEDLGASYVLEELKNQLYERNKEGYSKNYVIYDNNKVISHAATSAENDKVAILGYVITDLNYRGKGLAKKVCGKLCNDLISKGKCVFLVNYSNESTALYDKLGFEICCNWEKLFLNLRDN
jgi:hypothetical protein